MQSLVVGTYASGWFFDEVARRDTSGIEANSDVTSNGNETKGALRCRAHASKPPFPTRRGMHSSGFPPAVGDVYQVFLICKRLPFVRAGRRRSIDGRPEEPRRGRCPCTWRTFPFCSHMTRAVPLSWDLRY